MEITCLKCGSQACVKNGRLHGSQRYKCKNCGYQFTRMVPRGKPNCDKVLALILYLSGISMRMTAKIASVTTQTIVRWTSRWHDGYAKEFFESRSNKKFDEIGIDEMHQLLLKRNSLSGYGKWMLIPLDHSSEGFVGIVVQLPSKSAEAPCRSQA